MAGTETGDTGVKTTGTVPGLMDMAG